MNGLLIFFDGIPQDLDNFNGTESASFVFRRKDEAGESAFSFAPELTVVGDTYEYVRQQIINAPNPNIAAIEVLIYDTCCLNPDGSDRLLFTGKIEGGSVRWCTFPTCEAQVTVVDNSVDAEAIRCLKNHFPWDVNNTTGLIIPNPGPNTDTRGVDEFRWAPNMYYCNDVKPSATQEAIMILGIFVFIAIGPILFIIQLFNLIGNTGNNVFENLSNLIVGCGRRHLAPYLDSQFKNLCKLCNIGYRSSLFDVGGYYHNTVRMDIAFVPGNKTNSPIYDLIDLLTIKDNQPNLNGIQFLDELKQWNIEWRVINNVLQIERKDYFSGVEWFNTDNLAENQLLSICYESLSERPAAYAEYEYPKDGVDNSGDEVAKRWTDRVIDWNPANNPQQLGLKSKNFTFSASQFRFDFNAPDVNPIDKPFYVTFYPFVQSLENEYAMFLEKGISNFPKLINLREVLNQSGGGTGGFLERGIAVPDVLQMPNGKRAYNYKWYVKELPFVAGNGQSYDTAYQRLLYIDDPRLTSVKTRKVTISISADCDLLTSLDIDKYVTTSQGQVQITEITYDTNNNSLTIQGLI
jgi:hypothetical protein